MRFHKFLAVVVLFSALSAQASAVTVKTSLTCQQDEGDQWVEFGLVKDNTGRVQAWVVQHDDAGGTTLVARRYVTFPMSIPNKTVWVDRTNTLKITILTERGRQTANLSLILDGPGSIRQEGMRCYPNSSISFRAWPRN